MILVVVTACLPVVIRDEIRENMYDRCIRNLRAITEGIPNLKIVIVEGNGKRDTMLDTLPVDAVCYTENNLRLATTNKGIKELADVWAAMDHMNVQDDDFIVKLTGRYFIHADSQFMSYVRSLTDSIHAIVKFGPYYRPVDTPCCDCVTGLIGMRAKYVRQIETPESVGVWVEWKWGQRAFDLLTTRADSVICIKGLMGVDICPASITYFPV